MNVRELRIGNLVSSNDHEELTVLGVEPNKEWDGGYKIITDKVNLGFNQLKPIKLTEEWLLRFGGSRYDWTCSLGYKRLEASSKILDTDELRGFNFIINDYESIYMERVNQLQNLYFSLTKEELTLKETL